MTIKTTIAYQRRATFLLVTLIAIAMCMGCAQPGAKDTQNAEFNFDDSQYNGGFSMQDTINAGPTNPSGLR